MKKKEIIRYGIIATIIIILVIVLLKLTIGSKTKDENTVSRYEWIQMLTEEFGMTEYSNDRPYYKDVNSDNPYFASVQSAYEWKIIEENLTFNGEEPADGEFVALTSMKAIGKYKIQIYMGLSDEPKDKDYLELAVEKELLDKSQLNEMLSKQESQVILEKASELYLSGLWVDDFAELAYQDNIIEIENANIKAISDDWSQIVLTSDMTREFQAGDIIVFAEPVTGQKIAKQIASLNSDGNIVLDETSIDKVLTSLIMSDISEVTIEDILAYHNLDNNNLVSDNSRMKKVSYDDYIVKSVKQVNGSISEKGFAISLSAEEEEISVGLTDNNTGLSYELPVGEIKKINGTIDATIDVQRIYAGVQAYWSWQQGLEYVDIQIESDIQCSKELTISEEIKIPLITTPLYFGNGIVGINVEFNLVISVDGSVSIQASLPMRAGIVYEKGLGIRKHTTNSEYPESKVVANCSVSCMLNLTPSLKIFAWNVLDLDLDIGVLASAEIETRTNSKVLSCADLTIALPIFTVAVSTGESIEKFFDEDFSVSWEILNVDNTLYRKGLHYEWYSNGESGVVEECTYKEEQLEIEISSIDSRLTYYAQFTSDFIDEGNYYRAEGQLYCKDYIPVTVLKTLQPGESYDFYGHEYVYEGKKSLIESFPWADEEHSMSWEVASFIDGDNNFYYVPLPGDVSDYEENANIFFSRYYYVNGEIAWDDGNKWGVVSLIDDNYTFVLSKKHLSSWVNQEDMLDDIKSIDTNSVYRIELDTKGYVYYPPQICDGEGFEESVLHSISVEWEEEIISKDTISDEEAKEMCMELLMNLVSTTPETVLAYFDSNGDYSFDSEELNTLWYWTVDKYNTSNKKELSEEEQIAIGKAVYVGEFQTPDSLYNPIK